MEIEGLHLKTLKTTCHSIFFTIKGNFISWKPVLIFVFVFPHASRVWTKAAVMCS